MIRELKNRLKNRIAARLIRGYNTSGVPFAVAKHLTGKSDLTVVDVGAHEGLFTAGLDEVFGIRRGLLVELQPAKIDMLRQRFAPPRFRVVHAAVSNVTGEMDVEVNNFDPTTSILKTKRSSTDLAGLDVGVALVCRCPVATLDSIVRNENFDVIDLLKLDVQGAEHLVIGGASETLLIATAVWVEVSFKQLYEGSCLYNQVFDLLTERGFKLWDLETGFRNTAGELIQADALFLRS
jgi:FkbM family methyltransferase